MCDKDQKPQVDLLERQRLLGADALEPRHLLQGVVGAPGGLPPGVSDPCHVTNLFSNIVQTKAGWCYRKQAGGEYNKEQSF